MVRALVVATSIAACGQAAATPESTHPTTHAPASTPSATAGHDEPLPAYVPPPDPPYVPPPPSAATASSSAAAPANDPVPSAADQKECAARGGKIQPVCMRGLPECVIRYRDAGKRCTDKKECTGDCVYEGRQPAPATGSGVCQRTSDPCGCRARVIGGQIQPTMCMD
jgi:hypothetical protein